MGLPKLSVPTYNVTLPSNGKTIRVRPFLVKEEKMLLMAAQSKDPSDIINTTKQVITNCLVDDDVNVDSIPFFDIDYLFIALRAKSISESIEVQFTCNHKVDDNKCGAVFAVDLDIANVAIVKDETILSRVPITDKVAIQFKYPKYSAVKKILSGENAFEHKTKLIQASIDYIIDGENIYQANEYSKEDFDEFFENLTKSQLEKLEEWVDNFPSFEVKAEKTCPRCGFDHKLRYKDFNSFFF